jgi:hypothetical protein
MRSDLLKSYFLAATKTITTGKSFDVMMDLVLEPSLRLKETCNRLRALSGRCTCLWRSVKALARIQKAA